MAIEKFPDEISHIRALLSENPDGMTIRSISAKIGMNRNSVAKYLGMLQMQGSVTLKRNGPSKVYCLANKLPAEAVLKLTQSNVILFDEELSVVDVNDSMQDLLKISKTEFIKKTVDQLSLSVKSQPGLSALIKEGIQGKEYKKPAVIETGDRSIPCLLTVSPVYFENGNNGVSVIIDLLFEPEKQKLPEPGSSRSFIELDEIEYCCQFGPDGTLTYANIAYCEMMQKSQKDLLGHNWLPVITEKESRKIQKNLASLDPAHPVLTSEFRVITASGESVWQRWKLRGIFDAAGQVIQFQGVGLDISELKKTDEKLGAIEQDLKNLSRDHKTEMLDINRALYTEISTREKVDFHLQFTQFSMDNASIMIIWTDRDGRFIYLNKNAQKVLGYARRELLTKNFEGILSAGTVFSWEEVWKRIGQDHDVTLESSFETRDGRDIPVEMFLNYIEYKEKQYCCCFAKDISIKKQNDEAKRQSELRFKAIFHSTFQFIALLQPDGKVLEVNETALQFGGLDPSEVIGKPFWETNWWTISIQTRVHLRNAIVRAAGGVFVRYEVDVTGKGNTVATIDFSLRPIFGDTGIVTSIIAEGHDITGRLRSDADLRSSEMQYRSLFENMLEGYAYCKILFDHDIPNDFIYINVNSAFEKLTGLKNVIEKKASEVIPGIHTSNPKLLQIYSRVAFTGKTEQVETFIKSLGVYLAITVYSQKKDYFTVVFENITERKLAEEALRSREHDFSTLVENATDLIVRFDTSLHYVYCNPAVERQLGIPLHLLLGKTPLESGTSVKENLFVTESLQKTLETGIEQVVEQSVLTPSGIRHFQTRIVPERNPDGSIVSLLAITRDITERKQAEEMLQEKSRQDLQVSHDNLKRTEIDLRIHQTELEVQNEELRRAQHDLEVSRDRYFELYDLAPAGYLTISKQGLIVNANFTAATMMGVERGFLVKEPASRYIVKEDQEIFYRCRNEFIKTGKWQPCELRMLHAEGSPFLVQIVAVPASSVEGEEAVISLMLIDISGRRQTDGALQKSETHFGVMFENHDSVMLLIDPGTGKIVDANRAAEGFYGRSKENLCTLSIDEINILPPEEVEALRAKVSQGQITSFISGHRCSSGEIRTVEVHSSPIVIGGETVLFSIIHDITDHKAAGIKSAKSPEGEHGSR